MPVTAAAGVTFSLNVNEEAVWVHAKTELKEKFAKGLILGEVIAHEAGHLMLPHDSHSDRGIMRARIDMGSVQQARQGNLLFTPDQTKLIRAALTRAEGN